MAAADSSLAVHLQRVAGLQLWPLPRLILPWGVAMARPTTRAPNILVQPEQASEGLD